MTYYLEHDDGLTRTPCGDPNGYAELHEAHAAALTHDDLGTVRIMTVVIEVHLLRDNQAITEGVLP